MLGNDPLIFQSQNKFLENLKINSKSKVNILMHNAKSWLKMLYIKIKIPVFTSQDF